MITEGATILGPGGLPELLTCGVMPVNDAAEEPAEDSGVCGVVTAEAWSFPGLTGVLSPVTSFPARFESPLPLLSVDEEEAGVVVEELLDESFFLDEALESFARDNYASNRR